MTAPTSLIDFDFNFEEINESTAPTLAETSLSGSSSIVLSSDWSGDTSKAVILGARTPTGKYMQLYIAAGGWSDAQNATITTRPLAQDSSDINTADSSNDFDLPAGTKIFPVVSSYYFRYIYQAMLGSIGTGAQGFVLGNDTDQDYYLGYRDVSGTVKKLIDIDISELKARYYNDGSTPINIDTPAPANITTRSTTNASANNGELYQDSADNNSLAWKDNGGTQVKLVDDTLQLIPQASVEVWKDVTSDATELNQLDGTTNIAEADTFFGATDISGAEAEQLTDGSDGSNKHIHGIKVGLTQYNLTTATGTLDVAHGLTYAPRMIEFSYSLDQATGGNYDAVPLQGHWVSGTDETVGHVIGATQPPLVQDITNLAISFQQAANAGQTATVSAVDTTNFTLSWTKTGSPAGTLNILWKAYS